MPNRKGVDSAAETLIGMPRIARILHVTHPTATLYAARGYFSTRIIDGRTFARTADVLRYKAQREKARRDRQPVSKPAA